jgi:hypothetical protein
MMVGKHVKQGEINSPDLLCVPHAVIREVQRVAVCSVNLEDTILGVHTTR